MHYMRVASAMGVSCVVMAVLILVAGVLRALMNLSSLTSLLPLGSALGLVLFVGGLRFLPYARREAERLIGLSSPVLEQWTRAAAPKSQYLAVVLLSATSLFLELVLIRWQASLFPVFALYKNFTLLACFCGLGVGYAMSRRTPLLLGATLPMLTLAILLLTSVRYSGASGLPQWLLFMPIQEEASVFTAPSFGTPGSVTNGILVYVVLIITFVLNVLIMVPLGQFCGHVMAYLPSLRGYGCNLLGSMLGVAVSFLLSWLWMGPMSCFGLVSGVVLWYQLRAAATRGVGVVSAITMVVILAWPVEPLVLNVHSPYQLIQIVTKADGLMMMLSAGAYYQKVYDLSADSGHRSSPRLREIIGYYELPFETAQSLGRVAIVGAGSGNDVAAALRAGAQSVDAIEIDPAIIALGRMNHPEHPYDDARVRVRNTDARTFFRTTKTSAGYDAIVYGVLDSHILLSHGSNVRLDSFVYTQEGLREAYAHLKPGGLMSVSFALPNLRMGHKIYRMLSALPGAGRTVAVQTLYDTSETYTFLVRKGGEVALPEGFMAAQGIPERTSVFEGGSPGVLDLPTDDWPFFYMEAKMWPATYVLALVIVLIPGVMLVRGLLPEQRWSPAMLPFFLLGAGFMLVETKAITELGLIFGNTWQVVGITVIGVLLMAFPANAVVATCSFRRIDLAYAMLLVSVGLGYVVNRVGGWQETGVFAGPVAVAMLTAPLLFSGVVFSTLLESTGDLPSALAYNLTGAMLGGLLEYNSMQFGFAFLYLLALGIYAVSWITTRRGPRRAAVPAQMRRTE